MSICFSTHFGDRLMTIRNLTGKTIHDKVDRNHITKKNRKYDLALIQSFEVEHEYDILESEEQYLEKMGDKVVSDTKEINEMIKLLARFVVCSATIDLNAFEDVIRGKQKPTESMLELNDFGGYGAGAGYSDYKDAMHLDLSCKLIKRLQDYHHDPAGGDIQVTYKEILDCVVY